MNLDDLEPTQREFVLNGATGDDPLRDEDVVRLTRLMNNRRYFRQRNEYGPEMRKEVGGGRRVAGAVLLVVAIAATIVILIVGVR